MQYKSKLCMLMIIFSLSACDNRPVKSKIENPFAGHVEALVKAKDVEKKLLEAQQKTQDAIEKATK